MGNLIKYSDFNKSNIGVEQEVWVNAVIRRVWRGMMKSNLFE